MESLDLQKTANLLSKNWGTEFPMALDPLGDGWQILRAALRAQMRTMLADDFERLVQAMYRLDVAESKFRVALALPTMDAQADALADIVLDRELQRLATWQKYSKA